MARSENRKADKEDYFSRTSLPEFMANCRADHSGTAAPSRYLQHRALYAGHFGDENTADLLELLTRAEEAATCGDLGEIYELIDAFYPSEPLRPGEKVRTASLHARARARFLRLVLVRVLELQRFPAVLRRDLGVLLDAFPIQTSQPRLRTQRVLEANPTASYRAVAKAADVNQSTLSQWLKAGSVIDPHEGQRESSSPRPTGVTSRTRAG